MHWCMTRRASPVLFTNAHALPITNPHPDRRTQAMGLAASRPLHAPPPPPPGHNNDGHRLAFRLVEDGDEGKEREPPVLDLRDEDSVISFVQEKYGASGAGGRCPRCQADNNRGEHDNKGELLTLTELCIDVICANILRFVPEPLADDGGDSGSSGEFEEKGCDYDGYEDGGSPRTDVDSSDEDFLSHGRPLSPLAGLPSELVDRVLRSLERHEALLPSTLAALRGCDPSALDLSSCHGVTDAWLLPFAAAPLTDLCLRGAGAGVTDNGLRALQGLRHLRRADLSYCASVREEGLRAALCQTECLTTLKLRGCVQLTDAGIEPLPNSAATLRALSLEGCRRLTDATCFGVLAQLHALELLSLNQCQGLSCDGLLACLGALPRLRQLDLGFLDNAVGPDVLKVLAARAPGLEALVLDRAMGLVNADLVPLGRLAKLRRLSLRACPGITDAGLAYLPPSLQGLYLSKCTGIRRLPAHALPNLRRLDLSHTGVRDGDMAAIAELQALEELSLDSCHVGNAGLRSLTGGLKRLSKLNLTDTAITDAGLEALAALPLLATLSLFYCAITDQSVRHLASLRNLRRLNLDSRDLTDGALLHLSALTKLQHLDLFSARISDVGLCFLSSLSSLTGLELCGGRITDKGLEHLGKLRALKLLNLSQNARVTHAGLEHLVRLRGSLEVLNLSHTKVDGKEALPTLKQLRALKVLAVNGCQGMDAGVLRELRHALPYLRTVKAV